jgi:hypothetical protein
MRHVKLTDDELWRAIAQNTDEMSELVHQFDTDVRMGTFFLPCARSRSYLEAVNKFEREYQEYTAELRRRYLSPPEKRAVTIQSGIVAALISVMIVSGLSLYAYRDSPLLVAGEQLGP